MNITREEAVDHSELSSDLLGALEAQSSDEFTPSRRTIREVCRRSCILQTWHRRSVKVAK